MDLCFYPLYGSTNLLPHSGQDFALPGVAGKIALQTKH